MKAWENWAMISNGEIKNVSSFRTGGYTEAQHVAQAIYGADAFAVDVTYIPCQPGDRYEGGLIYDAETGKRIDSIPTEEESIELHERAIDDLTVAILEG